MVFSMADALVTRAPKGSTKLEKISTLIHWHKYRYRLKKRLNRAQQTAESGRPPYDELAMFKILILQRLYDLSDPQMEEMLYDRLSFRAFCGFSLTDDIPDETTICRFRNALGGKSEKLLAMVNEELSSKGLSTKSGTIVDATVIESSVKPPSGGEVSRHDPEAGWTKKRGEYTYGYKAHISSDAETGLIQRAKATSADVHDSQVFADLLAGNEVFVTADKAYDSAHNRRILAGAGIGDWLLYKAKRGKAQPRWQVDLNKVYSRTRSNVERIFGHLKVGFGYRSARYLGWAKNQVHLDLLAIAYNLSRAVRLVDKRGVAPVG